MKHESIQWDTVRFILFLSYLEILSFQQKIQLEHEDRLHQLTIK